MSQTIRKPKRRIPLGKRISVHISCAADDAEKLDLRALSTRLHQLSWYLWYEEWRTPLARRLVSAVTSRVKPRHDQERRV